MKIQLVSDVHIEFRRGYEIDDIEAIASEEADVTVIAGDFCDSHRLSFLNFLNMIKRPVLYVLGNHEFYGANVKEVYADFHKYASSNVTLLDNNLYTIDGVTFGGATMWYPPKEGINVGMMDFHQIRGFLPWVHDKHEATRKFLTQAVHSADVIVTHHMPTPAATPLRFVGSELNHFFCHDCTDLVDGTQRAKYWFFGHTHTPYDSMYNKLRFVANPRGYPEHIESRFGGHENHNWKSVVLDTNE